MRLKSAYIRALTGLTLVHSRAVSDLRIDSHQLNDSALSHPVHGNPYSKIYHRAGCEYGDKMSRKQIFVSPEEARSQGYRACSVCTPELRRQR